MTNQWRRFRTIYIIIAIRWRYREEFKLYRKSIKLGEKILASKLIVWDEANPFSMMTISFLAKDFHRMRSIQLLCKMGQAKDAALILRSILEDLIDFKYMFRNKDRIIDFVEYDTYLRLKMGRVLLKNGGPNVDEDRVTKRTNELQEQWDKLKNKFSYRAKNNKTQIHNRWTKKDLRSVAKEVDLETVYEYLYGYISNNFEHSTSLFGDSYILGQKGNKVVVGVGVSEEYTPEVLSSTRGIFLDLLAIVNEEYKLGYDKNLDKLGVKN